MAERLSREHRAIIKQTQDWIEKAVVGLNFCPFAKSVIQQAGLRCRVSDSKRVDALMIDLYQECQHLTDNPSVETSLLIIPDQLADFDDFNQMLDQADALLDAYHWVGVFQIASFHPRYQFDRSQVDDRENWSNRSPFPLLQLLREASVAKALSGYPNPEQIPEDNMRRLRDLEMAEFDRIFNRRS